MLRTKTLCIVLLLAALPSAGERWKYAGKLADDEITSQQLVAASVVRLNGNRIDVDLSQQ